MQFKEYDAFYALFLLVFPVLPVIVWCFWRKRKCLHTLADADLIGTINPSASAAKQVVKSVLLIAGFIAIVMALTRPVWNPKPREVKRKGRDVVILLDTSRSMLAEDIKPNRLERAKIAIEDLMETIQGDRIGIITFAGSASVKCPLTQDYAFVRLALDQIDTESAPRGGTNVGDAIRKAVDDVFDEQVKEYKDIILITDCEDQEESFPVQAAEKAGQQGIRMIAVGLGNPNEGARIPIVDATGTKSFLKYQGQEVWTKLDEKTLRQVASATPGGAYIPVQTGTFDLGRIYRDLVVSAGQRELESTTVLEYDEKFQIFLVLAFLLIVTEGFVGEQK